MFGAGTQETGLARKDEFDGAVVALKTLAIDGRHAGPGNEDAPVAVDELIALNEIVDPNAIRVGTELIIAE